MPLFDGADKGFLRALKGLEHSAHPSAQKVLKNIQRIYDIASVEGAVDLAELAAGPIRFAYIDDENIAPYEAQRTVGFRPQDMPKTVLVLGRPGAGKTTLFFTIICELLKSSRATCYVLDKKGDFEHAAPMVWEELPDGVLLLRASADPHVNTYFDNPFEPPTRKISKRQWYIEVTRAMGYGVFNLFHQGTGAFLEGVQKADMKLPEDDYVSIYHALMDVISQRPSDYKQKGRTDYYSHAEQFGRMSIEEAPLVLGCTRGIPYEEYEKHRLVIIDVSRCGIFAANLITQVFLLKICKRAQYETGFERDMESVLFIDEGQQVFGDTRQPIVGETIPDTLMRTTRSLGVWFFIANQTISTLSAATRKTAGVKIAFPIDNSEIRMIAESMGLTPDQIEQFKNMEVGQMFVKMDSRAQSSPFRTRAAHFFIDRSTPQEQIDTFFASKIAELRSKVEFVDEKLKAQVMTLIFKEDVKTSEEGESAKSAIDKKPLAFLEQAAKNPFGMTKDHAAALGVKPKECSVIQRAVADRGLVELYTVKIDDRPGKPATYTALTEGGRKILVEAGILKDGKRVHSGKSNYFHALLATGVIDKLTEDKDTECKMEDNGCDIGVYRDHQSLAAIEISWSTIPEDELRNLRRNLNYGWPRIITIAVSTKQESNVTVIDDEKSEEKKNAIIRLVREHLSEDEQKRVEVTTFHEFRRRKKNVI